MRVWGRCRHNTRAQQATALPANLTGGRRPCRGRRRDRPPGATWCQLPQTRGTGPHSLRRGAAARSPSAPTRRCPCRRLAAVPRLPRWPWLQRRCGRGRRRRSHHLPAARCGHQGNQLRQQALVPGAGDRACFGKGGGKPAGLAGQVAHHAAEAAGSGCWQRSAAAPHSNSCGTAAVLTCTAGVGHGGGHADGGTVAGCSPPAAWLLQSRCTSSAQLQRTHWPWPLPLRPGPEAHPAGGPGAADQAGCPASLPGWRASARQAGSTGAGTAPCQRGWHLQKAPPALPPAAAGGDGVLSLMAARAAGAGVR